MFAGFQDLPRAVYVLQIAIGSCWFFWAAIVWPWQRYWALKVFRTSWWRRVKAEKNEFAFQERLARAMMRSTRWRIASAVLGLVLVALGIMGLLS
jgi:hypothetical protein